MSDVQRKNESMSQRTNKPKPDSSSYVDNNSSSVSNNRNHNANMRIEYEIDSFHSMIITPNFSYSSGDNFSQSRSTTLNNDRDTVNSGQSYNWSNENSQTSMATRFSARNSTRRGAPSAPILLLVLTATNGNPSTSPKPCTM